MSHGPHADPNDPFQKRTAVAIALFTTVLAFANMLTNQARTQAILSSNRATNKWSHYQSKSTKQQLARLEQTLLSHMPNVETVASDTARVTTELARYDGELHHRPGPPSRHRHRRLPRGARPRRPPR